MYAYAILPFRQNVPLNPHDLFLPTECGQSDAMPVPSLAFKRLGSSTFLLEEVSQF